MIVRIIGIFAALFLVAAFSKKPIQVTEVPESHSPRVEQPSSKTEEAVKDKVIVRLAWEGKHKDANLWSIFVMSELDKLGKDLLDSSPADRKEWCKRYDDLDRDQRRVFYAQLISKMVQYESNYKPETLFVECSKKQSTYGSSGKWFADRGMYCIPGHAKDGGVAISRGLTQMSLQSAQGYNCEVSEPKDLHDPFKNISCTIRVMNRFIPAPRQYEGKVRGHGRISGKVSGSWKGAGAYWSVMRCPKDSCDSIKSYVSNLTICK